MHPDLQMRALNRLPLSIRRIATLAAEPTRTFDQVERARIAMDNLTLTSAQRLGFLPLWYQILDPTRIPTPEVLEILDPNQNRGAAVDISCAAVALHGIFNIGEYNAGVGMSLWSHMWPWVHFVHTHWEFLEGRFPGPLLSQQDFYISYAACICLFYDHSSTLALMASTPSFWSTIVRVWSFMTRGHHLENRTAMLFDIVRFVAGAQIVEHPERLDEMIEEAGGSVDNIGVLVVDSMRTVLRETSGETVFYLNRLIMFIADANDHYAGDGGQWPTTSPGPLTASLLNRGFAPELISCILTIFEVLEPRMEDTVNQSLKILRYLINHMELNLWLAELLERGFLRVLVLMAVRLSPSSADHVDFFLRRGIPTALVHYRAVVALKAALPLVEDLVSTPTFRENKKLSEQWKAFLGCISDNMVALEDFGQSFVAYKACDNTECRNMNEASSMAGRCSGCQAFYYCSPECQRIDWKTRHRSFCSEHKQLLLTARSSELEHRERWYIRALVHQRYIKYRRTICAKQIKVLASCDSRCILFTLFDHALSPPAVEVYKIDPTTPTLVEPELPPQSVLDTDSAEWKDLVSRVDTAADRGFHQLHGIRVVDYDGGHVFVVPLRTDSAAMCEALVRLAERVRAGELTEEEMMVEVDSVLAENAAIVEIH